MDDVKYLIKMYIINDKISPDKFFEYIEKYSFDSEMIIENFELLLKIHEKYKIVNSIRANITKISDKNRIVLACKSPLSIETCLLDGMNLRRLMECVNKHELYGTQVYNNLVGYMLEQKDMNKVEIIKYYFLFLLKNGNTIKTNKALEALNKVGDEFYLKMCDILYDMSIIEYG